MYSALDDMTSLNGNTYTAAGLRLTLSLFVNATADPPDPRQNFAVVLTDGRANIGVPELAPAALALRGAGVRVVVVGITDQIDPAELVTIAGSDSNVIILSNYSSMLTPVDSPGLEQLLRAICVSDWKTVGTSLTLFCLTVFQFFSVLCLFSVIVCLVCLIRFLDSVFD